MSNYSRVQDNLDCEANDFDHAVEVDNNENDSPTVVTSKNKRKKSSSFKSPLLKKTKWLQDQQCSNISLDFQITIKRANATIAVKNLNARGFSLEACRLATVKMIVLDELPFSVVEDPSFSHFCSVAAPNIFSHLKEPSLQIPLRCM
ncbi:hypothetical protein WN944_000907 [Citrus x changshan-huyou]|uniref:Uncharacterized protein n=1 Tax=Citrus x changshan-huyou TaxID=2935761 RepID=A0AAP0MG85_9ROSI